MTFRATGVFIFRLVCAYALGKAGSMMNSAAMSANGGKMPYFADWAVQNPEDVRHIHKTVKEMSLWPLCDIIFGAVSIGDVFVLIAAYLFAIAIIDLVRSAWKWSLS